MQPKEFTIHRGLTDNHARKLQIGANELIFESNDVVNNQFVTFRREDIAAFSFGLKWMRFYFVFGSEYVVQIKNHDGQVIRINFRSYFGRKIQEKHLTFNKIINELWSNYFIYIANSYVLQHQAGEEFLIGNVLILPEGIIINTHNFPKIRKALLPWDKVATKMYTTYLAIYAVDDAAKTNGNFSYLNDWNTVVLDKVIGMILKNKGLVAG